MQFKISKSGFDEKNKHLKLNQLYTVRIFLLFLLYVIIEIWKSIGVFSSVIQEPDINWQQY